MSRFVDMQNTYPNIGFHELTRLDGGNTIVYQNNADPDYLVMIIQADWNIYQTSTRVGFGTNYVHQGGYMNGSTGQMKGSDGHYYNYLNTFHIPDHRVYRPGEFRHVEWAKLHIETSGGYYDGVLNGRTLTNVTTKDAMNGIWIESQSWVNQDVGAQYQFWCTEFAKRRFNWEGVSFCLDKFDAGRYDRGNARVMIRPFQRNGAYNGSLEVGRPCFEVGIRCQFNRPPVSSFDAPSEVFAGNGFYIRNTSWDPDGNGLNPLWTVEPASYGGGLGNEGGWLSLSNPNTTYTIGLRVDDGRGGIAQSYKTIYAKPKGVPKLSTNIYPNSGTTHAGNAANIGFPFGCSVASYYNSGKTIDWARVDIHIADSNFSGGTITSPIGTWSKTYWGEITSVAETAQIVTNFANKIYNQYYEIVFTVHYSDTNTTDTVRKLTHVTTTNNAPNPLELNFPYNNSTIYMRKPIFLSTVTTDPDGDTLKVFADIYKYISNAPTIHTAMDSVDTNTQYLTPSGYYNGAVHNRIKIVPYEDIMGTKASINIKDIDDVGSYSKVKSSLVDIKGKEYLSVKSKDIITEDMINFIISRVNSNCRAYGIPVVELMNPGEEVTKERLIDIVGAINNYTYRINDWSPGNGNTNKPYAGISIDHCNDSIPDIVNKIVDQLYI